MFRPNRNEETDEYVQDDYPTRTEDQYGEGYDKSADDYGSKKDEYGEDYVPQNSTDGSYNEDDTNNEEEAKEDSLQQLQDEESKQKKFEHFAGAGAIAAGAYGLYERHEANVDPENAGRHQLEEGIAAAAAAGGGTFALYEHHQKEKTEDEQEELEGKKHGWFS